MNSYLSYIITLSIPVLSIGLLAFSSSGNSSNGKFFKETQAVTVGMTNTMKYTPDTVRIEKGQTVLWKNSSLLVHSVTGAPSESTVEGSAQLPEGAKPFDSGMMDPEETFEHTFNKPGTYKYFCIPHEGTKMFGWVIVE